MGFGFGIEKHHRAVFNEIQAHDAEALRLQAEKLPPTTRDVPEQPHRQALQHAHTEHARPPYPLHLTEILLRSTEQGRRSPVSPQCPRRPPHHVFSPDHPSGGHKWL